MPVLSKSSFGLFLRLSLLLLVLTSTASCSKSPLSLLTGGGPNVAANTQIGKTNTQTLGTTNNIAPTVSVRPNARVDNIDQSNTTSRVSADSVETVVVNEVPAWVILLLILGWLLPSPNEIGRWVRGIFKKK